MALRTAVEDVHPKESCLLTKLHDVKAESLKYLRYVTFFA